MKRLRSMAKLRDITGESLVESLVAILVCAMSAVMLVVATTSGVRMNAAAQDRDEALQDARNTAEQRLGDGVAQTVTVTSGGMEIGTVAYTVETYGKGGPLSAYALVSEASSASGYLRDVEGLWNTIRGRKVTVSGGLPGIAVADAPGSVKSQELQKALLAAGGGTYPSLDDAELSMSATMSSGSYVWKPVIVATGEVMLVACPANTSLGAVTGATLVYYGGSYYRWATLDTDLTTYVTDDGFDVSMLTAGGATRYAAAWRTV